MAPRGLPGLPGRPARAKVRAPAAVPFAAVGPEAYVAKVKNLINGLPPTAAELAQVTADPDTLPDLITTWMASDNFRQKQIDFFKIAFQQQGLSLTSLDLQASDGFGMYNRIPNYQNAMESFPRTAWDIVARDQPFNTTVTTDTWMMTPAYLSTLLYFDQRAADDHGNVIGINYRQGARATIEHDNYPGGSTEDPLQSSAALQNNATSLWYTPCRIGPMATDDESGLLMSRYLWGQIIGGNCGQASDPTPIVFADSDWTTWRPVHLRRANPGEKTTVFYDFQALRNATEVVLSSERVGFFTTPAFFANWPTNQSNQGRGITNQTLIVALGASFSPTDTAVPLTTSTLSPDHAVAGSECYGCHKSLDPMRAFFRRNYTLSWGVQQDRDVDNNDPNAVHWSTVAAGFSFGGVNALGSSMHDLGNILANHPMFASAWVQKLCVYANSVPCNASDPEFKRVAQVFAASNYNYKTLVRTLFASPLVTGAQLTQTFAQNAAPISVLRANHLCAALRFRLNLQRDPCGLDRDIDTQRTLLAFQVASTLPTDAYGRGQVVGTPATGSNLFSRTASEALCNAVAQAVVDNTNPPDGAGTWGVFGTPPSGNQTLYVSTSKQAVADAIADMVHNVMALPSNDSRAAAMQGMLAQHYADAMAIPNVSSTDALRSVFTLACTSPTLQLTGL